MMADLDFDGIINMMPGYLQNLQNYPLLAMDTRQERRNLGNHLPDSNAGIYVLYEDDQPLYVGRSNRLKERLLEHGRPSGWSGSATFAFILATEAFGNVDEGMARQQLLDHPEFRRLFTDAKTRIRGMGVRVVEIQNPIEQTIFEVYAHLELRTPYNSFENH